MRLTNSDIVELTEFRRELHRFPEVSGQESGTAKRIVAALGPTRPDAVITGLGGHGVAAVYNGAAAGPTVMIRSELDALPIEELTDIPHRSQVPGKGHLCGHDGHSTILTGLARVLARRRPAAGRVVLMFQPAEEDGSGAAAVIADPRFATIAPDWAFALHNMPGIAFGSAAIKAGPVNCASRGLRISLTGKTSHASQPEAGVSPDDALASLIPALKRLGRGGAVVPGFRLVTVTHAVMGEPAFGIAPGHAEVWVTLRSLTDEGMNALREEAGTLAQATAAASGLRLELSDRDIFHACDNDPEATERFCAALGREHILRTEESLPMRGSEDFGLFGYGARSAMVFLGAGTEGPMLHNPDYDFPDTLIAPGVRLFARVIDDLLG